ncbi:expressed unknown protein [Ectocarpus siliculosus]|uniref:Uncharacterized protein n=1 Tax=Ectocarpus siliculosus TaxID=2880 RepID=D7FH48_ECTSI|nr:expressed unknown protein [Ectocarpus siliculosus]|eukprot:CBJ28423.1 expressed unknown protein [Ectocarpus siliculosus]
MILNFARGRKSSARCATGYEHSESDFYGRAEREESKLVIERDRGIDRTGGPLLLPE